MDTRAAEAGSVVGAAGTGHVPHRLGAGPVCVVDVDEGGELRLRHEHPCARREDLRLECARARGRLRPLPRARLVPGHLLHGQPGDHARPHRTHEQLRQGQPFQYQDRHHAWPRCLRDLSTPLAVAAEARRTSLDRCPRTRRLPSAARRAQYVHIYRARVSASARFQTIYLSLGVSLFTTNWAPCAREPLSLSLSSSLVGVSARVVRGE